MTRANTAQNTSDLDKKDRNRREARKGYEAILYFLPQTSLSQQEKEEIDSKLTELKFALRSLGKGFNTSINEPYWLLGRGVIVKSALVREITDSS